jgi:hypothetical protein
MQLALYGMPELDERGHDACSIAAFCRNPLHPGPCKGWRHAVKALESDKEQKPATPKAAVKAPRAPRKAAAPAPARKTGPRDGDGDGKLREGAYVKKAREVLGDSSADDHDVIRGLSGLDKTALARMAPDERSEIRKELASIIASQSSHHDDKKAAADLAVKLGLAEPPKIAPAVKAPPRARALPAGQRGVLDALAGAGDGSHLTSAGRRDVNALVKKGWIEQRGGPAGKYVLTADGKAALDADDARSAKKTGSPAVEKSAATAKPAPKKRMTAAERLAADLAGRKKFDSAKPDKSAAPKAEIVASDYRALESLAKIPIEFQRNPLAPGAPRKEGIVLRAADDLHRSGYVDLGGPKGQSPIINAKGLAALEKERKRREDIRAARSAGDEPGGFDAAKAAHETDALDAAPSWEEAKRAATRGQGEGLLANMTPEQRKATVEAVDSYMYDGYFDINGSLHAGKGQPADGTSPETRAKIDAMRQMFANAATKRDSVLYRGTVIEGDPPDELHNPGFSSATSDEDIARQFSTGYYNGVVTGAHRMKGKPTVYELRVPKGYKAATLTRYGDQSVAEVLLNSGMRARKVADRGTTNGVRHVVYEVVPDGE